MRTLTDTETWAIANALRAAAKLYDDDALSFDQAPMAPEARASLARQFQDQAGMARGLADLFEGAGAVNVTE